MTSPESRTPLVSVVIAAFNASAHIESTCRSVLEQTYPALELIVVDDGSTDETADIIHALAASDDRITLIRQQNLGVAAARNRAIAASSGEFIAPLDADDLWSRTKIEQQVGQLRSCGPGTGMAYCWWAWIDANDSVIDRSPRWQIEGAVLDRLVEVNFTGSTSVPLYRRRAIDEVGGYNVNLRAQGCGGCEDWDLALRVAERYEVTVVPAILVAYRCRDGGMSSQYETMFRSHGQVVAGLLMRGATISSRAFRRSHDQFALYLAGVAFRSGDFLEACRWGLRARSLTLGFSVLPHVTRIVARRVLGRGLSKATVFSARDHFVDTDCPEPLLPYDRIYAREWRQREAGANVEGLHHERSRATSAAARPDHQSVPPAW